MIDLVFEHNQKEKYKLYFIFILRILRSLIILTSFVQNKSFFPYGARNYILNFLLF